MTTRSTVAHPALHTTGTRSFDWRTLLVCPVCKGELEFAPQSLRCRACGSPFHQASDSWVNLLPPQPDSGGEWAARQQEMESWYDGILANPDAAIRAFNYEYAPYQPLLADLSGRVLDLGGGNGLVRHFLPPAVDYVSLDPSLAWFGRSWQGLAAAFPCLNLPLAFVRGVGEYLPFRDHAFTAALAFWSLNHTHRPATVIQEVYRVLEPGGRLVLVLEDMEPRWHDLAYFRHQYQESGRQGLQSSLLLKARCSVGQAVWPLQQDHLRVREVGLGRWCAGKFAVVRRGWFGQFLTFDLCRTA